MTNSQAPLPKPVLVGQQATLPKPRSMTIGIGLYYLTLLLGLVSGIVGIVRPSSSAPKLSPALLLVMLLFSLLMNLSFIASADTGKNWARYVLLGFFALGVYYSVPGVGNAALWTPLTYGLNTAQLVLQAAGLACLFAPASTRWYKSFR